MRTLLLFLLLAAAGQAAFQKPAAARTLLVVQPSHSNSSVFSMQRPSVSGPLILGGGNVYKKSNESGLQP
jgi:hypothetical protein